MNRYVIFANGDYDPPLKDHIDVCDHLVAVDGGAEYAIRDGFQPEMVIGDFDSLVPDILKQFSQNQIIRYPADKDKTDLELAADYCVEHSATDIRILHACGGRMDQFLGNFLLFVQPKYSHLNVEFYCKNQMITILHPHVKKEFVGRRGDGFSIVPLADEVNIDYLNGTKWELKEETIRMGQSLSLSNEFIQISVKLLTRLGVCLVVHIKN
ncbi:MAG: thiamine diphosphokinase [candidate division KSB1 bacterium]|nr:thiamine diphosphokinase [candidate division KSB1 bacterium]